MKILALSLLSSKLLGGHSFASIIVSYNANTAPSTVTAGTVNAGIMNAGQLVAGTGASSKGDPAAVSGATTFNFSNWSNRTANGLAAIADNDFFRWNFTVNSGSTVSLTDLTLSFSSGSTGPQGAELFYSIDGGVNTLVPSTTYSPTTTVQTVNPSLTGLPLVTGGQTVTFTLAAYHAKNNNKTTDTFGLSGPLTINGTVSAVPEVSTTVPLFGILCVALMTRRRSSTVRG
jgi:hypothetical protein